MAKPRAAKRIPKSYKTNAKKLKKNRLSPIIAGFAGAVLAIPLMVAAVLPVLHHEFQAQAASLSHQLITATPTNSVTPSSSFVCAAPSGFGAGVQANALQATEVTKPSSSTTMPSGGKGGGPAGSAPGSNSTNVVTRLIAKNETKNQATIQNTGANSVNKVAQMTTNTTKVTNDNDIDITNINPQMARSGSVNASQNTTAGSTTSGPTTNTSNAAFAVKIDN